MSFFVASLLYFLRPYRRYLPAFLLYNLSDGLWAFSFALTLCHIWKPQIRTTIFWLVLFLTVAIAMECGQSLHLVPGTFDYLDILAYVAGTVGAYMFHLCKSFNQ